MRCSRGTPPSSHRLSCSPPTSASNVSEPASVTCSQFEYGSTQRYSRWRYGSPPIVISNERMSVKSDWHCTPGSRSCSKYTSWPGPWLARHCRTRRCSVRNWPACNCPAWRRCSSSNSALACSPGSNSSSFSHSPCSAASGSARVRQSCVLRLALGSCSRSRHLRAVRSLMPACAAAVASGACSSIAFISSLTCWSVTIDSHLPREAVSLAANPRPEPAILIVVTRQF